MPVHTLERFQKLPITAEEAWDFFSSPKNLNRITPPDMGFETTSGNENEPVHAGQIITYTVRPVLNIPMYWMTEIRQAEAPHFFIDEQRFGPYTFWHHKHYIKSIPGGIEMRDLIHYKLPFGFLGTIAHKLFVRKKLASIFDYRFRVLTEIFGEMK
jgi:ligand-binding SRPBCC domain-containing protein